MGEIQAPTLVLGEAPESDDDSEENYLTGIRQISEERKHKSTTPLSGSVVFGEATESDDNVEFQHIQLSSSINSFNTESNKSGNNVWNKQDCPSLKNLREKNKSLYDSLGHFKRQILNSSNYELSNINQQLLKSQIELQQSLNSIRLVRNNLAEYKKKLGDVLAAEYIPSINIKVPSRVI